MTDITPQFEVEDLSGTTNHFNGTVGTSAVPIPASAGNTISEVLVENSFTNSSNKQLLVSFDGGTTFKNLGGPGASLVWSPKGRMTQIYIKGNSASVSYEIIINRESD